MTKPMNNAWRNTKRVFRYSVFLLLVVVLFLEILFRLYDPFDFRQEGNKVVLPRNRKMIFHNEKIPGIGSITTHTKNSLGFRGPELPGPSDNFTSIIAVGGSTTECFYLDDSLVWTNLLNKNLKRINQNTWINNAGFQGHSTFGNFILINDYIKQLKPDYILLMEGINEIDRKDIREDESVSTVSDNTSMWGWLKRNSRVVNIVVNIQRHMMADRLGVTDTYYDPAKMNRLVLEQVYIDSALTKQQVLVNSYAKRLGRIIDTCVANNIQPVLITQPILYGEVKDCVTGTDLSTVEVAKGVNGLLMWKLIELYNEETRKLAKDKNLTLVDLAGEMPKCSKYFYDVCHFTNEGAERVAEILTKHLALQLSK